MSSTKLCKVILLVCLAVTFVASADEEQGRSGSSNAFSTQQLSHWAYQPLIRPVVPQIQSDRLRTPVDNFILSRLVDHGLEFAPRESSRRLVRRAYLSLTGLPPQPFQMQLQLSDQSPAAWTNLVESLLSSPAYGESWGRRWLDVVRYAETAGFNADPTRPLAYKYRDYVIRAFNMNKPYDEFIKEQLAGDELYPDSVDALVATGYNLLWPDESNASNVLLARQDALNDLTANVGAVFLGMSLGCAQCHDHKFDPILQADFYRLQAFFAGVVPIERVSVGTSAELHRYEEALNQWREGVAEVRDELHGIELAAKQIAARIKRLKFPQVVLDAIDTPAEDRTAYQRQLAFWSERQIVLKKEDVDKNVPEEKRGRLAELRKSYDALKKSRPRPLREYSALVSVEIPSGPPDTFLLAGGGYNKPIREVAPGVPTVMNSGRTVPMEVRAPRQGTSGRRSSLANWLTREGRSLSARVMVNRIWQGHFGRGLVANANDFGSQTATPEHPELLDWLAAEFVESGWDVKHMHRLIMHSAVYRQSSIPSELGEDHSRLEGLFAHYPGQRLSAEAVRDSMLSVAGLLNRKMSGASVRPPLPPKFSSREKWTLSEDNREHSRRSVYIFMKRNLPYPLLEAFDFPDMHESCAKRSVTTTAPQALMLLNSDLVISIAEQLARRVARVGASSRERVRAAYELVLSRPATTRELDRAVRFMAEQERVIASAPEGPKDRTFAALTDFCHALMNSNEFLYQE